MNFSALWFDGSSQIIGWLMALALFAYLLPKALPAWRSQKTNLIIASLIIVFCWCLRAQTAGGHLGGIGYHLLGLSLTSLMLGAPAAFCLALPLLVLYTLTWQGLSDLAATGINALALLLPATATTTLIRHFCQRYLPKNIFIFIFINGFFASALGIFLTALTIGLTLHFSHTLPDHTIITNAIPVFFFIAWGEAFLTGITTAIFIALAPQRLSTFSDQDYLAACEHSIWQEKD